MVLIEWRILCFIILCSTHYCFTSTVQARVGGYVSAHGAQLGPDSEYRFQAGEEADFSCHRTAGTELRLLHTAINGTVLHSTQNVEARRARLGWRLAAGDAGSLLKCTLTDQRTDDTVVIRVKLSLGRRTVGTFWLAALGAALLLLLAAAALWLWVSFKNHSKPNTSNMVTYTERNSIENLHPSGKDQNGEQTYVPAQNCGPNYVPAQNCGPNYVPAQNCEPIYVPT